MRIRTLISVLAVLVLVALGACGDDSKDSSSTTEASPTAGASTTDAPPTGSAMSLTIKDFKFSPNPLQAKVGDKVTVTNNDNTEHSVTADDGSFDTDKFASGSKTISLSTPGAINFHCKVHSNMKGVIQVAS
jgi:plastocyanin